MQVSAETRALPAGGAQGTRPGQRVVISGAGYMTALVK
jgi:hypothetical protein